MPDIRQIYIRNCSRMAYISVGAAIKIKTANSTSHYSQLTVSFRRTLFRMAGNTVPYPFQFSSSSLGYGQSQDGKTRNLTLSLKNVRGSIPTLQASRLRTMMLEAHQDATRIMAHACSYDGLSSRLVEEAGFPMVFLAGYAVSSSYGLPDTGYIAMAEM